MPANPRPTGPRDWENRYQEGDTPWITQQPSQELLRILKEFEIPRGRALELGCGDGVNAVLLARQGFQVSAVDVSETAIRKARERADREGVSIEFRVADVTALDGFSPPFDFVFDRGVYHVVRQDSLTGLLQSLEHVTTDGSIYVTLAGNANEETPEGERGPPRVSAEEICREFTPLMQLVQLREFRFDASPLREAPHRPLAWSALFRRASRVAIPPV
jgi:cyclopropane fatty-acyl-phospholipid synthase-like methyltransferase